MTHPILRGTYHATITVLTPNVAACLAIAYPGKCWEIAAVATIATLQCAVSAYMHLNFDTLSIQARGWSQRVDHCVVGLSVVALALSFGVWMPPIYLLGVLHVACKLKGPSEFTLTTSVTLGLMVAITTVQVMAESSELSKLRYLVVFVNMVMAQLVFAFKWPLNGHPVWGYHEIMHITTMVMVSVSLWNIIV